MTFGALETLLARGISALIADDPVIGQVVASPLAFEARLKVFDALVRHRVKDEQKLLKHEEMMKDIDSLRASRNSLVHGAWFDLENTQIDEVKGKLKQPRPILHKGLKESSMVQITPVQIAVESKFAELLCEQLLRRIKEYEATTSSPSP